LSVFSKVPVVAVWEKVHLTSYILGGKKSTGKVTILKKWHKAPTEKKKIGGGRHMKKKKGGGEDRKLKFRLSTGT